MFTKIFKSKHTPNRLSSIPGRTAAGLKQCCLTLYKQYPPLADSNFYTVYLNTVMLEPMLHIFQEKVLKLEQYFDYSLEYSMQLASISLSLSQEDGLLATIVKLWIGFCHFQLDKIILNQQINDQQKSDQIQIFFHKEFFLLSFYIFNICLYLYAKPFACLKDFSNHSLFVFIRNNITVVPGWKKIYQVLRKHIIIAPVAFTVKQVQDNVFQLQKLVNFSKIPIPFMQSRDLLKQFWGQCDISTKIRTAVKVIKMIKQQIGEYREQLKMGKNYLICADDIFTVLTYIMWQLKKNIYGACIYIQLVMCCQYEQIKYDNLAEELKEFHEDARHAYETIQSVSKIALLTQEQIQLIQ